VVHGAQRRSHDAGDGRSASGGRRRRSTASPISS
jgi:hypothetical protein